MESKDFHIGDVLSVAQPWLVSPDHVGGVYHVLDFMEGWAHFTHQLPAACDRVRPEILRQHPALADDEATNPGDFFDGLAAGESAEAKERAEEWCQQVAARLGLPLTLVLTRTETPSPPEDPIESLADMVGAERVYVLPVEPPVSP